MADVKGKVTLPPIDQVELDALHNGLELARRSAERQVKGNPLEGVARIYEGHLAVITALQARLPRKVS